MGNINEAIAVGNDFTPASPIVDFLTERHKDFIDDYGENCLPVATDTARMLLSQGMNPSVHLIQGERTYREERELLIPRPYKHTGKKWSFHYVAIVDGIVYDPMFDEPLLLDVYLEKAFENSVVAVEKVAVSK